MLLYTHLKTSLGALLALSNGEALTGLYFLGERHTPSPKADWELQKEAPLFTELHKQLHEYGEGVRNQFDLPLFWKGTPFQERVWQAIQQIPFGETLTYSELAAQVGTSNAVRAVGSAAGRNPLCWIIPCHRVVGKSGKLTGYAGGLHRKEALLAFERGEKSLFVTS